MNYETLTLHLRSATNKCLDGRRRSRIKVIDLMTFLPLKMVELTEMYRDRWEE
jgi:hypothetical protein